MTEELYIPDGVTPEVRARILADKDFILKFKELSKTDPEWATLTDTERRQRAREAVNK